MNKKHEDMLVYAAFALAGAILMAGAFYFSGCQSPYLVCNELDASRCSGQMVERCDGANWTPRYSCDEVWMDGVDSKKRHECVIVAEEASCQEVLP